MIQRLDSTTKNQIRFSSAFGFMVLVAGLLLMVGIIHTVFFR